MWGSHDLLVLLLSCSPLSPPLTASVLEGLPFLAFQSGPPAFSYGLPSLCSPASSIPVPPRVSLPQSALTSILSSTRCLCRSTHSSNPSAYSLHNPCSLAGISRKTLPFFIPKPILVVLLLLKFTHMRLRFLICLPSLVHLLLTVRVFSEERQEQTI